MLALLTKSASGAGPGFGTILLPNLPNQICLAWGWKKPNSILLGMTYPFNSQVRPCLSLILCVHGFPSYLAYNPRFLPCPAPGYFSALCSHLASFLKTPNGFSLKAFAFTVLFLRFHSSRYIQGLPPPLIPVQLKVTTLGTPSVTTLSKAGPLHLLPLTLLSIPPSP